MQQGIVQLIRQAVQLDGLGEKPQRLRGQGARQKRMEALDVTVAPAEIARRIDVAQPVFQG
jgi:hypothetical protein